MNKTEKLTEAIVLAERERSLAVIKLRAAHNALEEYAAKTKEYKAGRIPEEDQRARELKKLENRQRYETTNGLTIQRLRQAGHKLRVTHMRNATAPHLKQVFVVPSSMRGEYELLPLGGSTHIFITTSSGETYTIESLCHPADLFNYKLGIKTALDKLPQELADQLVPPEEDRELFPINSLDDAALAVS